MMPVRLRRATPQNWDSPFDLVRREFDRMLGDWDDAGVAVYPVDIREDQDRLYIEAELPGFTREQIDVSIENGVLTINAERKPDEKNGQGVHLRERRFTRVSRSFTLPNTIDPEKVDAKLDAGVLHLTLTKRDEVKPRKISIV
mgnify:CR=1 FL=1